MLALLVALVMFRLLPRGFANRDLRHAVAQHLGEDPDSYGPGRMTYDLRRLRMHGLIEKAPKSHRYKVTKIGFRVALLVTRGYNRLLRPGLSVLGPEPPPAEVPLRRAFEQLDKAVDRAWRSQQVAA